MSVSFHHFTVTGCCRIWFFLWRGKSRFVEPGVSNLFSFAPNHTVYLKLENLDVCQFSCQGYLFSMSTIHFATFTVTGFCRICQFSLFSQVSTVGLHLDNSVSNAMPGLLVFHVHHTFCNFHSDWILQDLPTLFFSFAPNHTVYLKLENLDVCQFSSFHSDWMLQDFIFSLEG